jgi:hypothetical protein
MSDPVTYPAEAAPIIWHEPASRMHEFWTRAGEVKDLRREVARLKAAAAAADTAQASL